MSIDLVKNPTGPGQACYKCGVYFLHTPGNPRGRQCGHCRVESRRAANRAAQAPVPRSAHTQQWSDRSLGLLEAAFLAQAWGQAQGCFVTGDCDE